VCVRVYNYIYQNEFYQLPSRLSWRTVVVSNGPFNFFFFFLLRKHFYSWRTGIAEALK